jgi:hypothetical protein
MASDLISPDERIVLLDLPPLAAADPALVTAFIGADPGPRSTDQLNAASDALAYAVQLGFTPQGADLSGLPLAFDSAAAFSAVFPDDSSWLAASVGDYFSAGGLRAIVIRVVVDPGAPLDAYVAAQPAPAPILAGYMPTRGLDIAMTVPQAGLVVLPDLEQLCFNAAEISLAQAPRPKLPPPQFRPLADWPAKPPAASAAGPGAGAVTLEPGAVLRPVNAALAAQRPDMQLLFSLPIGADQTLASAGLAARAKAYLYGDNLKGPALPKVQALTPMLNGEGGAASPSGLVAGMIAGMAEAEGVWPSLYGQVLPPGATPLRAIENQALTELRQWGVTVLRAGGQGAVIDGDYMAVPPGGAGLAVQRSAGNRRLMGWLTRQLVALGEQLVFDSNYEDGRVELILMDFFDDLQKAGALAGRQVSDAVKITSRNAAANVIAYDILIKTALSVETIQLQFSPSGVTASAGGWS